MDLAAYKGLFLEEANEHLATLSRTLSLPLEQASQQIDQLFRAAHSIKGMAAAMGFEPIQNLAHRIEDALDPLRRGQRQLDRRSCELLVAAVDCMSGQVEAIAADATPESAESLLTALAELGDTTPRAPVARPPDQAPHAGARAPLDPPAPEPDSTAEIALEPLAGDSADACPQPAATRHLRVRLSAGCTLPAARSLVVLREAARLGELVRSVPEAEALRSGRPVDRSLELELRSSHGLELLRTRLASLPDVEVVELAESPRKPAQTGTPAQPGLRVAGEQLDRLLDGLAELLLSVASLESELPRAARRRELLERFDLQLSALKYDVLDMRMQPFNSLLPQLERTLRETSRKLGKPALLEHEGVDVRLDRAVLEQLQTPLIHLLRNAIDHGLEPLQERLAAGKPSQGRLRLSLRRRGDAVLITLQDDGRGLDPERLAARALERGLLSGEQLAALSREQKLMLAARPGLSTAAQVSEVSGRGVGLDLVQARIEALGGRLQLASQSGRGTSVTLRVPLTLAMLRALVLRCGEQLLSVPIGAIQGVTELPLESLPSDTGVVPRLIAGQTLHVYALAPRLGLAPGGCGQQRVPAVVHERGGRSYAMAVDELLGEREVVVRPLGRPLQRMPEYAGAAILSQGELALLVDLEGVLPTTEAA